MDASTVRSDTEERLAEWVEGFFLGYQRGLLAAGTPDGSKLTYGQIRELARSMAKALAADKEVI